MNEKFINKIINLIKNEDYKNVLIEIENHSDNKNPFLLYYLAFTKDKLNQKEESLEILNKLIKNNPNFTEAQHLYSNINEDLKNYDISKNILESLIKKNPNDFKANYNLGRLHQLHLKNKKVGNLVKVVNLPTKSFCLVSTKEKNLNTPLKVRETNSSLDFIK